MVKKMLLAVVVMLGLVAMPRPALAASGCTTTLSDCMVSAAKVDSAWYRFAAGLDCELDYVECVRIKLVGI